MLPPPGARATEVAAGVITVRQRDIEGIVAARFAVVAGDHGRGAPDTPLMSTL